jgi:hypothetical protein
VNTDNQPRTVGLADKAEELGAGVSAGLLDRKTAAQQLMEFSDGGLTRLGAEGLIDSWQTVRARYADGMMRAEMGLAAIESAMRRESGGQP